jgi:hypothetical protein
MILYAATILVSSFLLFLIQPIIAKQILPWFGGTAAVWTTCLVFFQVTLLAGYSYSDICNRAFKHKTQSYLHIALLLASLAALPIIASAGWKPIGTEDPLWRILGLLLFTIGLPYFMLSTTAPLIQSWFAHEHATPKVAERVYRLFALSNLGALLGLLSYPFAIEPWVTTRTQATSWSVGYAVFVILCIGSAWRARTLTHYNAPTPEFTATSQPAPAATDYALWFSLASLPSLMLLAVTNHITQNVASIPFMWILPLSLYLLSFILCFEGRSGRGFYIRKYWLWPTLVSLILMAWGLTANYGLLATSTAIPLYCTGLFLVCMFCHGELAAAKPATLYLTRFYLILSLGGAAGGMFVGLLAPRIFAAFWELPLGLSAIALLAWFITKRPRDNNQATFVAAPWFALATLCTTAYFTFDYDKLLKMDNTIAAVRNFYGRLSVKQIGYGISDPQSYRVEMHGTIQHGKQFLYPANRRFTTSYYSESSGIGMAIAHLQSGPKKIGGIGMGIGTIAGHSKAGDSVKFYEINPAVTDFASKYFYYLPENPTPVSVITGDGRLMLEREPTSQQFDVLAIDAFSGDAVPVHLLTREAMALYLKHIKPNGAVAFHVTSRYLNLAPVVKQLADDAGYNAILIADESDDIHYSPSNWVIVTRNQDFLNAPDVMQNATPIRPVVGMRIWTDDFSNLFQVLK